MYAVPQRGTSGGSASRLIWIGRRWFSILGVAPPTNPCATESKSTDTKSSRLHIWPDGPVWALAESGGTIYVAGAFGHMGPWPQVALAAIRPSATVPHPISPRLILAQSAPNPAVSSALVRYSIPADLSVSLTIFDLQGRRSASVLSHVSQSAGPHQVSVRTDGLRAGCYLYCLEAGSLRATRKMVVVK